MLHRHSQDIQSAVVTITEVSPSGVDRPCHHCLGPCRLAAVQGAGPAAHAPSRVVGPHGLGLGSHCVAGRNASAHAPAMFAITEAEAAGIRVAFEQRGELSAVVELRRLFPGVTDNVQARECVRTIAGWKPLPLRAVKRAPRLRQAKRSLLPRGG